MDLNAVDLAKTLECPVCLDVFDEPKLLICGHTVCQKCVNKVVATHRTAGDAHPGRDGNFFKCPVCTTDTEIPPDGLTTNTAWSSLMDVCACNGCGKQAPVAETYTCDTCQEALNCKPVWICASCVVEQHRDHALSECTKATRQQIEDARAGIASEGNAADMYIGLTMSHLNRALKETERISKLLNQQKRGFVRLEESLESAGKNLAQEDLAAWLQAASDLNHKFEQAASKVGKSLQSALRDCREKLEDLFPREEDEDPMEQKDSGAERNFFDLCEYDDGQEIIDLSHCRVDAIPDLSRFTQLQVLRFPWNLLSSINDNIVHTTLTKLELNGNKIAEIRGLDTLVHLQVLNIGDNCLSKIQGLTNLVKLKCLYLYGNTIDKIEGLHTLVNLELLHLGGNRIKVIEDLESQHNLHELYLGANRIRKIENISHLSKLNVLGIPGNHITKLENLDTLVDLEQLNVSAQGIETFDGIQKLNKLALIDAGWNSITSLDHLGHLQQLEYLRLSGNVISQWPEVDKLAELEKLETVYLDGNPIQTQDRDSYRRKVVQALPQVTQVDWTSCR
ncbi:leucine Rich Repeat family protein [Aphelenchoides avenae]|nr:leucine Rich Repeat family protein [Aphelenchus avenae]